MFTQYDEKATKNVEFGVVWRVRSPRSLQQNQLTIHDFLFNLNRIYASVYLVLFSSYREFFMESCQV